MFIGTVEVWLQGVMALTHVLDVTRNLPWIIMSHEGAILICDVELSTPCHVLPIGSVPLEVTNQNYLFTTFTTTISHRCEFNHPSSERFAHT